MLAVTFTRLNRLGFSPVLFEPGKEPNFFGTNYCREHFGFKIVGIAYMLFIDSVVQLTPAALSSGTIIQ